MCRLIMAVKQIPDPSDDKTGPSFGCGLAGDRVDVSRARAKSSGEDEKPSAHTSVTLSEISVLTHLYTGSTFTRVDCIIGTTIADLTLY